ncbi:putative metal-binding motif-containing protein [Myxococcota bacterium]|nr:putative metal-binding motif-containing protein [Myxococcota bacterium]MBU1410606.1 putative metal-binding motif-containing protein [Myxococcota bacterium]MBU1511303.1 putative metal-binding motif-containing protein [Myxococcota bacterium]
MMKTLLIITSVLLSIQFAIACTPEKKASNNVNNTNNVNNNTTDVDQDGFTVEQGDCDDTDDQINPNAVEVADGVDNDCDGFTDDDYDGDGFGVAEDCNDNDAYINPGVAEACNDTIDNNCNGDVDEEPCQGGNTCPDEMKLVYVIERDNKDLYTFDPATLTFSLVGTLGCGGGNTPGSMGIARDGNAWVLFSDETLYEVDTETAACTQTPYSDASTGFGAFGMGFSSDSAGSVDETLFVANADTLGVLDRTNWTISERGAMSSQAEVTGKANGELWAILPLEARMVRLDKANADELETYELANFPDPMNIDTFAFAHWGGSLWVFIRESGMGNTTDIYQFDENHTFSRVRQDIGFTIVGAGVSTCAPIVVE